MDDASVYAAQDMAHEFCTNTEHCGKWHCPFVKNEWATGLYTYSEELDKFVKL